LKSGTQNSSLSMNKNKNSTKILNFDIDDEWWVNFFHVYIFLYKNYI
jgi:hypothetical protein